MFPLKMKNLLCIILLCIIFSTDNAKAKCMKNLIIQESVKSCYSQLNQDEQVEFKKNPKNSPIRAVQCMPKCVLEKMGFFKGGKFDLERMDSMTDHDVKRVKLAKNIKGRYRHFVDAAQKMADDCRKAKVFVDRMKMAEKAKPYLTKAYCPGSFWVSPKL